MILVDLAVSWGRIGIFGFGGGPALIPLMKSECVDIRGWLTEQQFLDALAAGTALPGPLAAKMSVHVGVVAGGAPGAAVAFAAVMGPPALMMLVLAAILARTKDHPATKGALVAVKPVVIALLAWTAIDLAPMGLTNWRTIVLGVAALAALLLKVHPALVLASAVLIGALAFR